MLSTCNAQNGICNVFEGALAISYESYTLVLYIPNGGSQQGSRELRAQELGVKISEPGAQEPIMANLGDLNPF